MYCVTKYWNSPMSVVEPVTPAQFKQSQNDEFLRECFWTREEAEERATCLNRQTLLDARREVSALESRMSDVDKAAVTRLEMAHAKMVEKRRESQSVPS